MTASSGTDAPTQELVQLVAGLSSVRMSDFSVVGAYMRFGEQVRERLKDARFQIAEACARPAKRRDNHLLWAAPGSGKTYFVEQVAASLDGVVYKELNLAKLSEEDFRTGLDEAISSGPTVCLVDEVDAKPDEPWPYETLMPFLDANLERGGGVVFVLAGSSGATIAEFKERIRVRPKGADVLSRVPQANGWEIAPMDAGDRILVALSQMLGAADELDRRVAEVEKLALYYVASAEHLANARQLREFAVRAVERGSSSNDRIRYDDLFDSGDPENKRFWMSAMPAGEALENSFVHIRHEEPASAARVAWQIPALPVPATRLVGRVRELAELTALLESDARLVTLTGPGGSGKTRLALEAATSQVGRYADGVVWVGLSALRDPALVIDTIEQALGVDEGLAEFVGGQELLLLLDNFEQVMDAAPDLARLLASCPNLKLLVTSRELLRIGGEVEYAVPPLAEPDAVDLFCQRARLEPDATILELCRSLDELPLALELAAARTSILSPAQILDRLGQRLDLLKGGRDAEARQQTLRATIEWSHELLDDLEQRLFARLAVFRGGCTLETAEEVAEADLDALQSLVDKNLVRHTNGRFWMLETVRAFARERLAGSGEEDELRRRHALATLGLAERADEEFEDGLDYASLYARMDVEHDNVRAALEWARDSGDDEILFALANHLASSWGPRGYWQEADTWLGVALERPATSPTAARIGVLRWSSIREAGKGDYPRSDALVGEWLQLAEQAGDESEVLRAMNSAALNASEQGELDRARSEFVAIKERAEEIDSSYMVAFATVNLGEVGWRSRDFESSLEYSLNAAALFRELGDEGGVTTALLGCGWTALAISDSARAEGFFREALGIVGRLGWVRGTAEVAAGLGATLIARDEAGRGAQLLGAARALYEEVGTDLNEELQEQIRERAIADAEIALGADEFAAAWARGEGMTLDEVVAFGTA
jgi:predicted ATPase